MYEQIEDTKEAPKTIKNALTHVILAMRAYIKFYSNDFVSVGMILNQIEDNVKLSRESEAALLGIQAAFLVELPPKGTELAVFMLRKVISLDERYAEWHFLLGKCLGRIKRRNRYQHHLDTEEIIALEQAVALGNNVIHLAFLAQTYREIAKSANVANVKYLTTFGCSAHSFYERSYKYYVRALELKPECCNINTRCAMGFKSLPPSLRKLDLAKQCIDKALKSTKNNAFVSSIAGEIYLMMGDEKQALKYLKFAGEHGSFTAYILYTKLNFNSKSEYNPLPDLENALEKCYEDVLRRIDILCHIGCYHYFIQNNFEVAAKYWMDAISLDSDSPNLTDHRSAFLKEWSINIYEVLLEETL